MSEEVQAAPAKVLFLMDANNIENCMKNGYRCKAITTPVFLDYHRIAHELSAIHGELVKSYYFTSLVDPQKTREADNQRRFLTNLKNDNRDINKIEIVSKSLLFGKEKGIDVGIAVKMLDYATTNEDAKKVDMIILFSGDSDFADALDLAQSRFGKKVLVIMFSWNKSFYLEQRFPTFYLRPNLVKKFARK